jgi:EmrB/QacA subfamily drug resistance transporter
VNDVRGNSQRRTARARYSSRKSVESPGGASANLHPGLSGAALTLVLIASFMVVLDFSIVNVALPSIHHALGFGSDSVQWVVTAYAITFSGLLILGGRIGDLFGRRRIFVAGLLLFAAASLAAGLSTDAVMLVIARAVQGIGAAMVAPASLSLITARIGEGPQRTRALGLYGATASIGFVAGQVLGGVGVQYFGWASIFLVNVPVGIVVAVLATRFIGADHSRAKSSRLDVWGGVLVTTTIAAAVYAVSEGPVLGWIHPAIIAAVVLTLLAAAGFIAVERVHSHPLVKLPLLARPNIRTAGILAAFMGAWTAGELVVMSLYLQQTLHDSPLVAGLVIAPQGVVGFITGMFGSRLARTIGLRKLLISSTISVGVGFLILMNLPTSGHYSAVFLAVLLIGFGTVGTVFGTTVMASQGMADADQGLVGGVVNTTRQVGAAMGVAVLVAVAEGSHASQGVSTIGGDRIAILVAGLVGLTGTVFAWFGARTSVASSTSRLESEVAITH